LILSGSGADAAYQIGVVQALCSGRSLATGNLPIEPGVFAAASTGAFNACLLVSQWDEHGLAAVPNLEKVWRDRLSWNWFGHGGFRLRLNPLDLLDPRGSALPRLWTDFRDLSGAIWTRASKLLTSRDEFLERLAGLVDISLLIGTEPWKETIAGSINFEKIGASRLRVTVATTNWDTGGVCSFVNRREPHPIGPEVVRAASAVPGFYRPESVDGQLHTDGESQMNAPLKPAIDQLRDIALCEPEELDFHLHIIYLCARKNHMPVSALESTLQMLYGTQVINWTSRIDQDLQRAQRINQGIVMIEDLAALHKYEAAGSQEPETEAIRRIRERVASMPQRERQGLLTTAARIMQRRQAKAEWQKLTIHRYFPPQGLDSMLGFLDYRRSRLDRLIEQGFTDTAAHDCQVNRCVQIEPGRPAVGSPPTGELPADELSAGVLARPPRHALIFSGGGAYGAYQVGCAKALFHGSSPSTGRQPLEPEVFAGTSVGAFNASFLVSKWHAGAADAVAALERAWLERIAWKDGVNGAFRFRLSPFELLFPGGRGQAGFPFRLLRHLNSDVRHLLEQIETRGLNLFRLGKPFFERLAGCFDPSVFVAAEPWEETIRDLIDFEKIHHSSRRLTIAATNWTRGTVSDFRNRAVSPEAIRASSAVPGFYPPATVHNHICVDGAVLMNTPLKPAIRELQELASQAGESDFVLHVVYMSAEVEKASASEGTLQTLFRAQAIQWGSTVEQDIEYARKLNQGLSLLVDKLIALGKDAGTELLPAEIEAIRESVDARSAAEGKALLETSEKIMQSRERGRPFRQLTIHRYFPRKALGGVLGFVDVRRSTLEKLIQQGFEDTLRHDCKDNRCVLVGE
jgi:predicted acylesterase/phospholipase RssA